MAMHLSQKLVLYCLFIQFMIGRFLTTSDGRSRHKDDFLVDCLIHRNDNRWLNDLPGTDLKSRCMRFLDHIRNATKVGRTSPTSTTNNDVRIASHDLNTTIFSYISAISNWRNREGSIENLLLNYVSPCYTSSKKITKQWKHFFSIRQRTSTVVPLVHESNWKIHNGTITIRPSRQNFDRQQLVAAEVVVLRQKPLDIGEAFGTYSTMASVGEGTSLRTLHTSLQPTCSFGDGRFLVLDLKTTFLTTWHRSQSHNLTIFVNIQPRQRFFHEWVRSRSTAPVVDKVLGLVLHFRHSSPRRNRLVRKRLQAKLRRGDTGYTRRQPPVIHYYRKSQLRRRTRSADTSVRRLHKNRGSRATVINTPRYLKHRQPCHLISFVVNSNTTKRFKVSWPEQGKQFWDISECVGSCALPIPDHVDATNHAILISYEATNRVCCVPTSFETQHYITQEEGELVTKMFPHMIATNCGCR